MDYTNLVNLVTQGGAAASVIVITIVFLNHMREERKISNEASRFAMEASTKAHTVAVDATLAAHKLCEEKLEILTEKVITVVQDSTKGFAELKEILRQAVRKGV